jgi:hypothetical protein
VTPRASLSNRVNPAAIGLSLFFATYLWFATQIHIDLWSMDGFFTARSFPFFAGGLGLISSVLIAGHAYFRPLGSVPPTSTGSLRYSPLLWMVLLISIYITLIDLLGFVLSSIVFIAAAGWLSSARHYFLLLTVAVTVPILLGFVLSLLGIYLDPGAIIGQLGFSR